MSIQRIAYFAAIACSSILLFSIQPVITKAILPYFGGSAGVWTTAMLFFQVMLLLGYLYAWGVSRMPAPKMQSAVHAVVVVASLAALPIRAGVEAASSHGPLVSILRTLFGSIGLPFFVLSSTTPLLQSWFADSYSTAFPWRLYSISNLASVAVLIAYPVVIEPHLHVSGQFRLWSAGYALAAGLIGIICATQWRANRRRYTSEVDGSESENRPILWIMLAACSSILWLAVANHLSQEVAPVPFLWVLPLSVYLVSFILCFESERKWYRPGLFRWLLPLAWVIGGYSLASVHGLVWEITAFSVALFIWCMFCQGELAQNKPGRRQQITFFYLMIALGGAFGGLFVGVAAPMLFSGYLELPIGIAGSVLLAMPLVYGVRSKTRLLRLGVVAAVAFFAATKFRDLTGAIVHVRNFYGALQVMDSGSGSFGFRSLYNGRTLHGVEFLSNERSLMPTAYYGPESGAGKVLSDSKAGPRRVGIVGLGVGTLAAYGREGDVFRFYEVNPAVVRIASDYFHFLHGSAAKIEVLTGDGRLLLEKEPANSFDILVLDAFSDDTIPVHLITKEAFALYFRLLGADGTLAIHLTNRYIDLDPVVDGLASVYQKHITHVHSSARPSEEIVEADWAIISGRASGRALNERNLWTDDYSNLFGVLK